jgi:hypothetical protein
MPDRRKKIRPEKTLAGELAEGFLAGAPQT